MRGEIALSRSELREHDPVGDAIRIALVAVVMAMLLGVFAYASSAAPGAGGTEEMPEATMLAP
jgi:hypothetical protein